MKKKIIIVAVICILIDFISKNNDKYLDLLSNTPDKILNNNYKVIRSALNI